MSIKLKPLTAEEIAWTNQQPVVGKPSLTLLRAALEAAGLRPVELALDDDGENVEFRLERGPAARQLDREQTLRMLITTFRGSGFEVGFTEMALADCDDDSIHGMTLVGPLELICEHGPVPVEP
jgi:hypothetical protein